MEDFSPVISFWKTLLSWEIESRNLASLITLWAIVFSMLKITTGS